MRFRVLESDSSIGGVCPGGACGEHLRSSERGLYKGDRRTVGVLRIRFGLLALASVLG